MTKTDNIERLERHRAAHHAALEQLAGTGRPGKTLWRELNQLERELYRVCLDYTNAENGVTVEQWEAAQERGRYKLRIMFGSKIPAGIYINGDPRGHMLKLDCEEVEIPAGMVRDMGGDGILAATIE